MNFRQVEEIKKHEDDPGQREEDPCLSINQHRKFVVFLSLPFRLRLLFLFKIPFFIDIFGVETISETEVKYF